MSWHYHNGAKTVIGSLLGGAALPVSLIGQIQKKMSVAGLARFLGSNLCRDHHCCCECVTGFVGSLIVAPVIAVRVPAPTAGSAGSVPSASAPKQIIGALPEIKVLPQWIASVFDYWCGSDSRNEAPGKSGLSFFETLLCKPIRVLPLVSRGLALEEKKRVELTRQQARLLRAIGMRRRAMICGGAGTGKTLLAFERAQDMSRSRLRTLLLCYNRALGDHLKAAAQGIENLHTMTFHQLCDWRIRVALTETGKDLLSEARGAFPDADHYRVHLPMALTLAIEETSFRIRRYSAGF
jgi:hypothetical protein